MKLERVFTLALAIIIATNFPLLAAPDEAAGARGDAMLADYFQAQTTALAAGCLDEVKSLGDWRSKRETCRQQLFDMLGLWPQPERGELKAEVTGKVEHELFTVENLHFQSLPGLYVTANLYLPRKPAGRVPAILYLSGHGPVITNGISYGNKVTYQHHGAWFARHGYACLVLDTLQLGEIQGLHHGTYREKMWWWNARGYTPAGVEAWNCIRALDYLETRPEVDAQRIGATGRSGGGAYSWWVAALDERIKAAAPVAGITDLENHVVDGCVEGHCDCMFFVNTCQWDYPLVAALVAPRPLLIVNTDSDTIFPLDGVYRTFEKARRIYELHNVRDRIGLVIGPGPHKDTQDLQVPVFRWFNRHLRGEEALIEAAAVKYLSPEQLKVFRTLPADAVNTNIQLSFVPAAKVAAPPESLAAWAGQRDGWLAALKEKTFAGWPDEPHPLGLQQQWTVTSQGLTCAAYEFNSQPHVRLRLYVLKRASLALPQRVILRVLDDQPVSPAVNPGGNAPLLGFEEWLAMLRPAFEQQLRLELAGRNLPEPVRMLGRTKFAELHDWLVANPVTLVYVAPRGIGLSAWSGNERKQTHVRRRFMLLGQTLDGMRVWDIRRAIQAAREPQLGAGAPVWLQARGILAADALYATLFEPGPDRFEAWHLPASHMTGPDYLNVLRILDLPQAVAMSMEQTDVRLHAAEPGAWAYPQAVARLLGRGVQVNENGRAALLP